MTVKVYRDPSFDTLKPPTVRTLTTTTSPRLTLLTALRRFLVAGGESDRVLLERAESLAHDLLRALTSLTIQEAKASGGAY